MSVFILVGVNNQFLVATGHELAIQYNNVAVLEHLHAALTIKLLKKHNLLEHLDTEVNPHLP